MAFPNFSRLPFVGAVLCASALLASCKDLVVIAQVVQINLSLDDAEIMAGRTTQLTVVPLDAKGNALSLEGRQVSYRSAAPSVATVNSGGVVLGNEAGSTTLTAEVDGVSRSVQISVFPRPVTTVEISPNPAEIWVGNQLQLSVTLRGPEGTVLSGRNVVWASSDGTVASVDATRPMAL